MHPLNKRQKLDPLITNVSSDVSINKCRSDLDKRITSVNNFKHIHKEINLTNDNVASTSYSNCNLSKPNTVTLSGQNKCKNVVQQQFVSNSFLDDDDGWFQENMVELVQTCTQVEAEVSFQTTQSAVPENVKAELNCVSSNLVSSNKLPAKKIQYINNRPKTPLRRTTSGGDWPSNYSQQNTAFGLKTSSGDKDCLRTSNSEIERLKNKLKAYEEKLQTKEGEVRVLRNNLDQVKKDLIERKQESITYKDMIQVKMKKTVNNYEKEIMRLKTQLHFKHMDVVVAQSESMKNTPEFKKLHNGQFPNESVSSAKFISNNKKVTELLKDKEVLLMQGDLTESCDSIQACQLLLEVTMEIFYKSKPEAIALDPLLLNLNPVLKGSIKIRQENRNADGKINQGHNTISLRTTCLTLEHCYQPLITLTNMVDLCNKQAHECFMKILTELIKILEELLARLKSSTLGEHFMDREKEIYENWHTYVPLVRSYSLLDYRSWYDEEKGVEARRCLGLLSVLIQLSSFVMLAVLPTSDISVTCQQDKDNSCGNSGVSNDQSRMILYTIREIVREIQNQRRTLSFEGVLTGVIQLITSLARNEIELPEDSQLVLLDILRSVINSRPGSTVLLKVFEFLLAADRYPSIRNYLCCKTAQKTCIEDYLEITYTNDTCIVQLLCFMIRQLPEEFRYKMTNMFVSWLHPLFVADQEGPPWLHLPPDSSRCQCRSLVTQLTVTLLGEICRKYEKGDIKDKKMLEEILPTGISLVQNLVYQDENFPTNVGEYSGQLVLFPDAVNNLRTDLNLQPVTCKILEKLTKEVELRECSISVVESEELSGLLSSINVSPEEL